MVLYSPLNYYKTLIVHHNTIGWHSCNDVYRREPGWSCGSLFGRGFMLAMLDMLPVMLATLDSSSTSTSSSTATVTIWSSSSYTKTSIQKTRILIGEVTNIFFPSSYCSLLQKCWGTDPKIHSQLILCYGPYYIETNHNFWIDGFPLDDCICPSPNSSLISNSAWYIF